MTARSLPPRRRLQQGLTRRTGFTLLEMLAVILIIAILVAVAFPAYNAVMVNARIAAAKSEMSAIGTSIAEFKSKFNIEPPSYIDFQPASGDLKPQTKAILRQMFPQITFGGATYLSLQKQGLITMSGGSVSSGVQLRGSEALVFFLGGMRQAAGATPSATEKDLVGFSKNPANPFALPAAGQSNRLGPYFEFDSGRLVDTDMDGALEYLDRLPGQQKPLLYLSTARTGSYIASDAEGVTTGPPAWMPYQKSASSYWNPNSFQLISPGFDGDYGLGGVFNPDNKANLNTADADNLTNFYEGRLGG